MKTYSVSAETSRRILENWIVEAKNKAEAVKLFRKKANIGASKISHLVIKECREKFKKERKMSCLAFHIFAGNLNNIIKK
jgi:hypothetical protein